MSRVGWLDTSSGVSGDMLLGALVGAGVPVSVLQDAVDEVAPERVELRASEVRRAGLAATRVEVDTASTTTRRTWRQIRELVPTGRAHSVFARLAQVEARVHGTTPDEVHFHEVGALDAIADVVGACAGLAHLGLDRLVVSPLAVGGGTVRSAHGTLPVPVPAVVELLRGMPSHGGPVELELTTPTGAALVAEWADGFGVQPAMVTSAVGIGAGSRDPAGHANVVRLLIGDDAVSFTGEPVKPTALVIESNIDDLDPRLWPDVLRLLLKAGAADAWLTPILMKKGRPAHTLSVLVAEDRADAVRREIFRQTSTIGVRERSFTKHALDREMVHVEVDGQTIDVKLARLDGELLNVAPEYDHVVAAAGALDRPIKDLMAQAVAAARRFA